MSRENITMAMTVVANAARAANGKLERCKSGYWRVPGTASFIGNDVVRRMEALNIVRYTKARCYRGKRSPREAELVDERTAQRSHDGE